MAWRVALVGMAAAGIAASVACTAHPSPAAGPASIELVQAWIDARNSEDIESALALLSPTANVLGFPMQVPSRRQALVDVLEAQAIANWRIHDSDCTIEDTEVSCTYQQDDAILRRWGLTFRGTHTYSVENGSITRVARAHDPDSQDAGYAALRDFKNWVRETHADLVWVIWADPTAATYSDPAGARAALAILDEYEAFRATRR